VEEQSRLLVQAIIQTIHQEIQMLETKIGKGCNPSLVPNGTNTTPQSVSTYRIGPVTDKGIIASDDSDFLKRDSHFQFPRSDCPGFNDTNPVEWVCKCNSYFDLHQIPIQYCTHLATIQFHEDASEWYDGYSIAHEVPIWEDLVRSVTS
jgi:hypothetical protein